jgi:ligand-binding sensor domain-containing protein
MAKRKLPLLGFLVSTLAGAAMAATVPQFNQFVNYAAVMQVNDFAIDGNVIWVATTGGLYRYNCTNGTGTLYTDPALFPDLNLTCLCFDANHTLWIGTGDGHLYERSPQGGQEVYTAYVTAGWQLNRLLAYGRWVIAGAAQGVSVFDTASHLAVNNAASFGPGMPGPQVFSMTVYRDTLILGCIRGVAKLALGGERLQTANFYDPSIWTIDSSLSFEVNAIIVGSTGYQAEPGPSAMLGGHLVGCMRNEDTAILAAQGLLAKDGTTVMTLPSMATTITADTVNGRHRFLIGTRYNYFYFYDGNDTVNCPIAGPTFSNITKVYVDREGLVWACPSKQSAFRGNPWWEGISVLRNNRWQVYSPYRYPSMLIFGGTTGGFNGAVEDNAFRMWFGSRGGQVKRYDRATDSWLQYNPGAQALSLGKFHPGNGWTGNEWGICDGTVRDSVGFLWFTSWDNLYGSVLCYDSRYEPDTTQSAPSLSHYRYLYGTPPYDTVASDTLYYSTDYSVACVDAANELFVGEGALAGSGKYLVLSYAKNPLTDQIVVRASGTGFGVFTDAAAAGDSLTYIGTTTGFYTYSAGDTVLRKGLRPGPFIDSTFTGIQALALQDDHHLWIGTVDSGIVQYDLGSGARITIGMQQGLLSNNVQTLAFDRKNGYLWVGTDKGLSRFSLGYTLAATVASSPVVYPNPFSKHRHQSVVFAQLPPASKVCIYTLAGTLVAVAPVVSQGGTGTECAWTPPSGIVPGIYLYTIQATAGSSRGRFIITP